MFTHAMPESPLRKLVLDDFFSANTNHEFKRHNSIDLPGVMEFYYELAKYGLRTYWNKESVNFPWEKDICVAYHNHEDGERLCRKMI
jgi:hypothetical protein